MAKKTAKAQAAASQSAPSKLGQLVDFFNESKVEIKKVTWPTRKETITTCIAVVVLVIVVSLYLRVIDFGLEELVKWMLY
ncbi:MAG: preprotein translocase subunit SecE [Desulfovibrio sp.]|nr:MAG: preprotein translocase subunit SecE [Desulfovibrio sp.]